MIEKRIIKDRDEWLRWRQEDVTASDIGALLGINEWKSPLQVYADKMGQLPRTEMTGIQLAGLMLEPAVEAYVRYHHPKWEILTPNYYLRDSEKHIGCTPDRITGDGKINIQLKTVGRTKWKKDWQNGPPFSYQLQTLCEAMLQGAESSLLAIGIRSENGFDYEEYEVPRNAEAEQRIYDAVASFWHDVDVGFTPDPDWEKDGSVIRALRPPVTGTEADLTMDNELHELIEQHERAKASEKDACQAKEAAKNQIIYKIDGMETVRCGPYKITRKLIEMKERIVRAHTQDRMTISQPKGSF